MVSPVDDDANSGSQKYTVLAKDIPPAIGSYVQIKARIEPYNYLDKTAINFGNMLVEIECKEITPSTTSSNTDPLKAVDNQVLRFSILPEPPTGNPFPSGLTIGGQRKWYIGNYNGTSLIC